MGVPMAMMGFLQRKYDIMQQQADAETLRAKSLSNLEAVRAGLLPSMTSSDIAKNDAAIVGMGAETAGALERNKWIGREAQSGIDLNAANAYQARASGRQSISAANATDRQGTLTAGFTPFRFTEPPARIPSIDDMLRRGFGPFVNDRNTQPRY